jgi:hypothetical protein
MRDNINGKSRTIKIPKEKYRNTVKFIIDEKSKALSGIKITSDEDKQSFQKGLQEIKRFEEISGTNSFITAKYQDAFESGKSVKAFGYNDILQLIAYDEFASVYDKNKMNTRTTTNTLKESIARLEPEDKDYKAKVIQTYHSITTQEKHTRRAERDSSRLS